MENKYYEVKNVDKVYLKVSEFEFNGSKGVSYKLLLKTKEGVEVKDFDSKTIKLITDCKGFELEEI